MQKTLFNYILFVNDCKKYNLKGNQSKIIKIKKPRILKFDYDTINQLLGIISITYNYVKTN